MQMKKISIIILSFAMAFISVLSFGGCKKDDFEKVYSVTFTMDGKSTTKTSYAYLYVSQQNGVTQEVYYSTPKIADIDGDLNSQKIALSVNNKTISSWNGITEEQKGEVIGYRNGMWFNSSTGHYVSADYILGTFEGFLYYYVLVRVVDDDTIIIKDGSGQTTYNVSSYKISKFA